MVCCFVSRPIVRYKEAGIRCDREEDDGEGCVKTISRRIKEEEGTIKEQDRKKAGDQAQVTCSTEGRKEYKRSLLASLVIARGVVDKQPIMESWLMSS